ncbi:MAG: DNA-3-methyladenine glycosylase 2 family protein [bacterium]
MTPEIIQHFRKNDAVIYEYLMQYGKDIKLSSAEPKTYFFRLSREIASQQLHSKAAKAIWGRFENIIPDKQVIPENVLKLSIQEMRSCGLSYAKANYIHNIANAFISDKEYSKLNKLSNDDAIELLTRIKGVGRWTAEMFLMFTLGRENIFSYGDLGLKKGLVKIYKLRKEPSKERIEKIVNKWSPYKTYGAITLWRVLDNK